MKKTYINPDMTIVKIETQQMIAMSGPEVVAGGSTDKEDDLLSHGSDFDWDDEE